MLSGAFRHIRSVLIFLVLSSYAFFMAFIWFGSSRIPDSEILARIAASILSDMVWIPLGLLVWAMAFKWFLERLFRPAGSKGHILSGTLAVTCAVIWVAFFSNTAFAFLFIPLAGIIVLTVVRPFATLKRNEPSISNRWNILTYYVPIALLISLTIFNYRWQMLPCIPFSKGEHDIKVMSYNIYSRADHIDRLRIMKTIKRELPDVVCCIEFNPFKDPELFKRELGDIYNYYLVPEGMSRWTQSSALIISRYPLKRIQNPRSRAITGGRTNFIFAEMNIHGRKVNIVNYHLSTVGHYVVDAARKTLNLKKMIDEVSDSEEVKDNEKYNQAQFLLASITDFKEPTIICGDLNDTPNSRAFHLLNRQYINTYSSRGWGLGATFGESWIKNKRKLRKIPFISWLARDVIRIDHIFVSKDIEVMSAKVVKNARGSDHKPVIAVLRLAEEQK